jgi:hypothetical protein
MCRTGRGNGFGGTAIVNREKKHKEQRNRMRCCIWLRLFHLIDLDFDFDICLIPSSRK